MVLDSQPDGLDTALIAMKSDKVLGATAIRGLAFYESPTVAKQLMNMYPNAKHDHRPAIIDTLASRPTYASTLVAALANGNISSADIPAATASRIVNLGDSNLTALLEQHWGTVQASSVEKQKSITHYRDLIDPDRLSKANQNNGRRIFTKLCANCHTMFGQGSKIGPDLTGSNRDSADYLLDNIIDPSRIVPRGMRQSLFLLDDGRVVSGVPVRDDTTTVTVQTATEVVTLDVRQIETRKQKQTSLMPEGLLKDLSDQEVRDLFAYLQSSTQVAESPTP